MCFSQGVSIQGFCGAPSVPCSTTRGHRGVRVQARKLPSLPQRPPGASAGKTQPCGVLRSFQKGARATLDGDSASPSGLASRRQRLPGVVVRDGRAGMQGPRFEECPVFLGDGRAPAQEYVSVGFWKRREGGIAWSWGDCRHDPLGARRRLCPRCQVPGFVDGLLTRVRDHVQPRPLISSGTPASREGPLVFPS